MFTKKVLKVKEFVKDKREEVNAHIKFARMTGASLEDQSEISTLHDKLESQIMKVKLLYGYELPASFCRKTFRVHRAQLAGINKLEKILRK